MEAQDRSAEDEGARQHAAAVAAGGGGVAMGAIPMHGFIPTRAGTAGASPLAAAAHATAYYPVIADPLLQGTGGAAISVPSGLAPIASGAPQGLVPVFAVPAGNPGAGGGNRMIPQATAVWMVPQPGGAAGGGGNQPAAQFWAIQSAPQLINLAGAQTIPAGAVFPTSLNVADYQHQISAMSTHNSNSEQQHSHGQQRGGGGGVDHPEEEDDDDDEEPASDSSPEE
ncbi:hypothetical protein PR202_gb02469 [Eleusine coracana subsp. coracana]|uniref:Uncharacterized protein n=1 Tax=Eleusine coracana subsp. coracana TaxID=191504 RepID=A0AAV5DZ61_ELECO|nr:hypothetical protein PR202_gb02469 [Eleusine coracana subsp. coracana]